MKLNVENTIEDNEISTKKLTEVRYVGTKSTNKVEQRELPFLPGKNNPKYE